MSAHGSVIAFHFFPTLAFGNLNLPVIQHRFIGAMLQVCLEWRKILKPQRSGLCLSQEQEVHSYSSACLHQMLWSNGNALSLSLTFFLLVPCEFHIMHSNPTHLPLPRIRPLPLLPPPSSKEDNLIVEAIVCHSGSHRTPFSPHFFACTCSTQWLVGLVWGLWLLLH